MTRRDCLAALLATVAAPVTTGRDPAAIMDLVASYLPKDPRLRFQRHSGMGHVAALTVRVNAKTAKFSRELDALVETYSYEQRLSWGIPTFTDDTIRLPQ